jgi:hypothetical protein
VSREAHAVIQPLTDFVWLGGDGFDDDRLIFATRLFAAISTLETYYQSLLYSISDMPLKTLDPHPFPFIRKCGWKTCTYLSCISSEPSRNFIYEAHFDDDTHRRVVVKFTTRYHAQAHRLLAEYQLAPFMHYSSTEDTGASMYGGRYMVVMDFVDGKPPFEHELTDHQFVQIG